MQQLNTHGQQMPERRPELDWLRIIAFGLLFIYHTGMLYVANWGFHIKSTYTSETLEGFMLLLNPWRMPLLWLISGVATRYMLAKLTPGSFALERSFSLLFPLLVGVLLVVPPQLYYEMQFNGDLTLDYLSFYQAFFNPDSALFSNYQAGIWPHIDVNHLWYLRELWYFTLIVFLLSPLLNAKALLRALNSLSRCPGIYLLLTWGLIAACVAFIGSREASGFFYLLSGYLLAWQSPLWEKIKQGLASLRIAAPLFVLALIGLYFSQEGSQPQHAEWVYWVWRLLKSWTAVLMLLLVLSLGGNYLTQPGPVVRYLSMLVFPFYIFHQSFIILWGAELGKQDLGPWLEPVAVFCWRWCQAGSAPNLPGASSILDLPLG